MPSGSRGSGIGGGGGGVGSAHMVAWSAVAVAAASTVSLCALWRLHSSSKREVVRHTCGNVAQPPVHKPPPLTGLPLLPM